MNIQIYILLKERPPHLCPCIGWTPFMRSNPALSGTGFGPLSHRIDQVLGEKKNRLEQPVEVSSSFFWGFGEMHPRTPQKKSLSHCTVEIYKKVPFYSWTFCCFFSSRIISVCVLGVGWTDRLGRFLDEKCPPSKRRTKRGKLSTLTP